MDHNTYLKKSQLEFDLITKVLGFTPKLFETKKNGIFGVSQGA